MPHVFDKDIIADFNPSPPISSTDSQIDSKSDILTMLLKMCGFSMKNATFKWV